MMQNPVHIFIIPWGILFLTLLCGTSVAQVDTAGYMAPIVVQLPRQHWRLSVQNGVSRRWEDTSRAQDEMIASGANVNDVDDYYQQHRQAYHFSADVQRLFADRWGIGFRYSVMINRAEQYIRFDMDDGINTLNTELTNRMAVNFAGASFFFRQRFAAVRSLQINASITLGYARYRNEFQTDFSNPYYRTNTLATGNTFGGGMDMGLEYFAIPMVSVALGFGCFLARFDQLSVNDGQLKKKIDLTGDERKNASRFDIFFGFRVYF